MNAKEVAQLLNRRKYRNEITSEEEAAAKSAGLVIVFGASDDLMEFRGAIRDEIDCYDGGKAYLTAEGLLTNECENDECPHFERLRGKGATIEAVWGRNDITWIYETAIPHETFTIVEDGETYCIGIVFALADAELSP
jgi:hypothetical protein